MSGFDLRALLRRFPVPPPLEAVLPIFPNATQADVGAALAAVAKENEAMRAHVERERRKLLVAFPEFSLAVAPVPPAPRADGTHRLSVDTTWREVVERGLQLREGSMELGPFTPVGDCLGPLLTGERAYWVDPTLAARDGDIVLVEWDPAELAGIVHRGRDIPEWLATYGATPPAFAFKVLREFSGSYWLLTNSSMLELGKNRILGTVTRVQCSDASTAAPSASNIAPGAATLVIQSASRANVSVPTQASSSDPSAFWSPTVIVSGSFTAEVDGVALVTWTGLAHAPGEGFFFDILATRSGTVVGREYGDVYPSSTDVTTMFNTTAQFGVFAGETCNISGRITRAPGAASLSIRQSLMKVEYIKR